MRQSVKELRKAGRLDEAYELATQNYMDMPDVWTQRDLSWVLYEYIKKGIEDRDKGQFFGRLEELSNLGLDRGETMLGETIVWCYSKWIRNNYNNQKDQGEAIVGINKLLDLARNIPLVRPDKGYSSLLSSVHKAIKGSPAYIEIIDRLGLDYFQAEDFLPYTTNDGKRILSQVEQVYNQYSKCLLSKMEVEKNNTGAICDDTVNCADLFLVKLADIIGSHPEYTYPLYYKAKLLLSLGHNDAVKSLLIPFVKKKSNDFWVWQILGDAIVGDKNLALSCYSKGLLCKNQEEMLVGLREAIARLMIECGDYAEAKFELQKCIDTRLAKWGKIPSSLEQMTKQAWFNTTTSSKNNNLYYQSHSNDAEMIVWSDDTQAILITYVKADNHIANFITEDNKVGYFKYNKLKRFKPKIGEVYNVVMNISADGKPSKVSFFKRNDNNIGSLFYRTIEGRIRRKDGHSFAFVEDVYISPEIVSKYNLQNADEVKVIVMKSYNKKREVFSWSVTTIFRNN